MMKQDLELQVHIKIYACTDKTSMKNYQYIYEVMRTVLAGAFTPIANVSVENKTCI